MQSFDVVVVGSFNTDLSVFTDDVPNVGQTVMGARFVQGFGGKGANQATASKRLGCEVSFITRVGNDVFGKNFISNMESNGMFTGGVMETPSVSTGVALITVEQKHGDNRIIVVPGANMVLCAKDIDNANAKGFLKGRVLVCQLEIDPEVSLYALRLGQKNGIATILNPAPMSKKIGNMSPERQRQFISEILSTSTYCCPNETEAMQLVEGNLDKSLPSNASGDTTIQPELIQCLHWMAKQGVKYPIITLGSQGVMVLLQGYTAGKDLPSDVKVIQHKDNTAILHMSAPKITDVVDTTGAGDSFVGAFSYFIACHSTLGIVEHIRRAIWVASQSVRKIGTQLSYPRRSELPAALFESRSFTWPPL